LYCQTSTVIAGEGKRSAKEILSGKSRENGSFGDQEGSIKMDVREISSEDGK
jgi:hypothetical protein